MKNNLNLRLFALSVYCILFLCVCVVTNAQEGNQNKPVSKHVVKNKAEQLSVPQLVTPIANAKLNMYPRKTIFEWKHVNGAINYEIEVEYNDGKWQPFQKTTVNVVSYTCDFVGANPGRWRVRAIGKDGQEGSFSAWRGFKYTK
jgi:hypothetical protein